MILLIFKNLTYKMNHYLQTTSDKREIGENCLLEVAILRVRISPSIWQ